MQTVAKQKQIEFSDGNFEVVFDEGIRILETVVASTKDVAFYELFRQAKTTERIAEVIFGSFGPQLNFELRPPQGRK